MPNLFLESSNIVLLSRYISPQSVTLFLIRSHCRHGLVSLSYHTFHLWCDFQFFAKFEYLCVVFFTSYMTAVGFRHEKYLIRYCGSIPPFLINNWIAVKNYNELTRQNLPLEEILSSKFIINFDSNSIIYQKRWRWNDKITSRLCTMG